MIESSITRTHETALAVRRIQRFTIVWMAIEVAVAFIAAIRAHSVALAAFGGDCAIELLSTDPSSERIACIVEEHLGKVIGEPAPPRA